MLPVVAGTVCVALAVAAKSPPAAVHADELVPWKRNSHVASPVVAAPVGALCVRYVKIYVGMPATTVRVADGGRRNT
jgi:hypothetical protein